MRKTLMALAGAALLAVGFASGANAAALVISDQGCSVLDGNNMIVSAGSDHSVLTGNARGNAKLTCKVKGVAPGPARFFGSARNNANSKLPCLILGAGSTYDWSNIVSASGNVTLQCKLP